MTLIDKDAVVAEIKRLIDCCYKICAGNLDFLQKSYPEHYYSIETYKEVLYFLDTLEVKDVDFDKELSEVWRDWANEYDISFVSYKKIARHFYELGLKTQKGENI